MAGPGEAYEKKIRGLLTRKGLKLISRSRSTFDKYTNDIEIKLKKSSRLQTATVETGPESFGVDLVVVELKTNERARMGSGSLTVIPNGNKIELYNENDSVDNDVFIELVQFMKSNAGLQRNLINLINELNDIAKEYENVNQLPAHRIKKTDWDRLVQGKFVRSVSAYITRDAVAIRKHYLKKGADYLQIGGKGIFKLSDGNNPLQLDVPLLTGSIRAQLRAARSGENNKGQVTVSYRVEYRLAGEYQNSSLSLDKDKDIEEIFRLNKPDNENN